MKRRTLILAWLLIVTIWPLLAISQEGVPLESFRYKGAAWMIEGLEELRESLWPSFSAKRSEDGEEWICYGTPTDLEVLRDFGIGPGSLEERAKVARFKQALLKADSIELLKLYPRCTPIDRQGWFKRYFHHYEVLGSIVAKGEQKSELVESLWKGMQDGPPVSMCFEPRHGMVAKVWSALRTLHLLFLCHHSWLFEREALLCLSVGRLVAEGLLQRKPA